MQRITLPGNYLITVYKIGIPMVLVKRRLQKLAGLLSEDISLGEVADEAEHRIVSYYEIWSEEDVEIGETDNKGDLDNVSVEPDEFDKEEELTAVDKAIDYLKDAGAVEASSSHFHPGVWYSAYGDSDFVTGERTNESYHLEGFSEEEEAAVFKGVVAPL